VTARRNREGTGNLRGLEGESEGEGSWRRYS